MCDKQYNGWTNYATWRINLEICEDYLEMMESDGTDKYEYVDHLAEHLEDYVDEILTNYGEVTEGPTLDYARAFVSDVNWDEIAEKWPGLIASDDDEEDE